MLGLLLNDLLLAASSSWRPTSEPVRIPSIAKDVATDLITVLSRTTALRRQGLTDASFVLIASILSADMGGRFFGT